jgi:hypothetical protein
VKLDEFKINISAYVSKQGEFKELDENSIVIEN